MRLQPNPVSGVLFGVGLAAIGFFAIGSGHGTYVLIGASSAPFGMFGVPVALAGAPLLWAMIGVAFDWLRGPLRRGLIVALLIAHYAGAVVLLSRDPYGDWDYLRQLLHVLWPALFAWLLLYVGGQVVIWRALLVTLPSSQRLQPTSGEDAPN